MQKLLFTSWIRNGSKSLGEFSRMEIPWLRENPIWVIKSAHRFASLITCRNESCHALFRISNIWEVMLNRGWLESGCNTQLIASRIRFDNKMRNLKILSYFKATKYRLKLCSQWTCFTYTTCKTLNPITITLSHQPTHTSLCIIRFNCTVNIEFSTSKIRGIPLNGYFFPSFIYWNNMTLLSQLYIYIYIFFSCSYEFLYIIEDLCADYTICPFTVVVVHSPLFLLHQRVEHLQSRLIYCSDRRFPWSLMHFLGDSCCWWLAWKQKYILKPLDGTSVLELYISLLQILWCWPF